MSQFCLLLCLCTALSSQAQFRAELDFFLLENYLSLRFLDKLDQLDSAHIQVTFNKTHYLDYCCSSYSERLIVQPSRLTVMGSDGSVYVERYTDSLVFRRYWHHQYYGPHASPTLAEEVCITATSSSDHYRWHNHTNGQQYELVFSTLDTTVTVLHFLERGKSIQRYYFFRENGKIPNIITHHQHGRSTVVYTRNASRWVLRMNSFRIDWATDGLAPASAPKGPIQESYTLQHLNNRNVWVGDALVQYWERSKVATSKD